MPLVIPPGFAMFNLFIHHTGYERRAQVTYAAALTGSTLDPVALANGQMVAFNAQLKSRLDISASLEKVDCRVGQDAPDPLVGTSTNPEVVGTNNIDSTAPGQAVLVQKRSASAGRRNRGRMYWPWIVADTSVGEDGVIASAVVTATQTAFNLWLAAEQADPAIEDLVILHDSYRYVTTRPQPGVKVTTRQTVVPPAPTVITALVVDNVISSQRERQTR